MTKEVTLKSLVLGRIKTSEDHAIFFLSDFSDVTSLETIRKIFADACSKKILSHVAHGIYVKPKMSTFGEVPVSIETIAIKIAQRDHAKILPTGSHASNIVGLSTQVPTITSYLTTGSTRDIKVGNRIIRYTHAAPRNFAYSSVTIPLIVQAMKDVKKENIGPRQIAAIARFIEKSNDKETHQADLLLAPAWVRKILKSLNSEK